MPERINKEKSFGEIFSIQNIQYEIPFFQRGYVWGKDKWDELFYEVILENIYGINPNLHKRERILEIADIDEKDLKNPNYYFGTIYLKQKNSKNTQSPDGQQRLMTIYLFSVKLFYDLRSQDECRNEILEYQDKLFNENREEAKIYTLKSDEKDLLAIITQNNNFNPNVTSNISGFSRWYDRTVRNIKFRSKYNLFLTLFKFLKVTQVTLSKDDDEMLIFENLNDKGTPLRGDELLCNYIFQPLIKTKPDKEIEEIHRNLWLTTYEKIQQMKIQTRGRQISTGEGYLFFLRTWFSIGKNKMVGRDKDIYYSFKRDNPYTKDDIANKMIKKLEEIKEHVVFFQKAIFPREYKIKNENPNSDKLNDILEKIDNLKIYTGLTFLIPLLQKLEKESNFLDELIRILKIIYVFLIRRNVLNKPTYRYNIIFPNFWDRIKDSSDKIEKIKQILKEEKLFVSDEELQDSLSSSRFYEHPLEKLLLREIDKYFCKKSLCGEYPDYSSINTTEHILPQNFEVKWKDYLAEEYTQNPQYTEIINNRIHTIGNLMLMGVSRNTSRQNNVFLKKLEGYEKNTGLSKDLLDNYSSKKWNVETIEERSKKLAIIVAEIFSWDVE